MQLAARRVIPSAIALVVCVLAVAWVAAGEAAAAVRQPGLRPAPAALTWLEEASLSPLVAAYPSSFDLRSAGKVSPVRDQSPYGTCWTFAALGSLESCLLPAETWDFSEDNVAWYSGFDDPGYEAGNSFMVTAYLTRWEGPFTEAQDGYSDGSHPAPATLTVQKHVQDVVFLPTRTSALDNDDIKYALTTWGGVYLSMYYNDSPSYWDMNTDAYYYGGSSSTLPNHAILVVGWDDDYAASNFASTPPGDGAFLIKNSWGPSFGDAGYFWLSYYDKVAGYDDSGSGSVFRAAEPTTNYARNYQHDPLGFVSYVVPLDGDYTDWFAARYVASASDDLTALGFWTLGPNAGYRLYAGSSLDGLTQVGSGTYAEFGYHTARFTTPYQVTQGQPFYVAVRLTVPDFRGAAVPKIALEDRTKGYTSAASASAEQTYLDTGGGWVDVVDAGPGFEEASACLKAYTGGVDGPHTTVTGADTKWHASPVNLDFTGSAPAGIEKIEFSVDGGPIQTSTSSTVSYTVDAPADHGNDGAHTVTYWSTDLQGTVETPHTCSIKIDTQRPVTKAPRSASVRRYGYVTLRYRVNDLPVGVKTATVTIRIKTLGGVSKKTFRLGSRATNTTLSKRFRCELRPRTYRFYVYAVDQAGHTQSVTGRNRLVVR